MDCSMPGFPVLHGLPEFAQTHVHWVSDAIQPSHTLLAFSSCLQSFPASGCFPVSQFLTKYWSFSFRWPKYWRFSFSISPSSEYLGMTSFRMDLLDLLAFHGTLIPQLWNETKYLYISKAMWVIPVSFGKPLASKFSSLFQKWWWKVCSPKSSLRYSICQKLCFPQSRLLSSGPRCSSSAPLKGNQPWGKCCPEGKELCNLWLFPSRWEKSPTRAASVTENEKARRNDWSHEVPSL